MTIEERLKRVEEKLGLTWGKRDGCCDHLRLQIRDAERAAMRAEERSSEAIQIALNAIDLHNQPTPKQATIKIGPMHPDCANQIASVLDGVGGIRILNTAMSRHKWESGHCETTTPCTLTITGPAK